LEQERRDPEGSAEAQRDEADRLRLQEVWLLGGAAPPGRPRGEGSQQPAAVITLALAALGAGLLLLPWYALPEGAPAVVQWAFRGRIGLALPLAAALASALTLA